MKIEIPNIDTKAYKENLKSFFLGPTFNIHKTNVNESDPIKFVLVISIIFSLFFSIVFKGGFDVFFALIGNQLSSIILVNNEISIAMQIVSLVLTFGSIILAIIGWPIIRKKKYVCLDESIGLIIFCGGITYLYHATFYYNVTDTNWFLYAIYILPTIVFIFASGVLAFRFFVKLFFKKNLITPIRKIDFDYRNQYEKDFFKRMWLYLKSNFGQVLTLLALIALAIAVLYPLVILIMRSINDPIADMKNPFDIPTVQSFDNYKVIWDYIKEAFINSLVTTLGVTIGTMICASLLAYAFIRFNFKGKTILYFAIIGLMMIPGILTLISRYQLVQELGLVDDGYQDYITRAKIYGGIILPGIAGYIPMAFMLLFTFFKGIPHDLFEAADVDGASNVGVFLSVVIPLSKPILSTIAIQTFVGEWNDYLWANLVHGNDGGSATLPVILQTLSRQAENGAMYYSTVFAGYVLSAIPLVLIFIVASKQFIEGLTSGAFKM